MADDLVPAVAALLQAAAASARTPEAEAAISDLRARLGGPLRLAIAGKVKAGKSTLLNALISEELAATDAGECTRLVTWYREHHHPQVLVHPHDSPPEPRPFRRDNGALQIDLGGRPAEAIDHIEVLWPTTRLRDLVLIDTPGIASITADVSARTHQVLAADDGRRPLADAVLYLLRHTHASDIRFLEAFHDNEVAHGTPMNAIGVLSRADEIGSCRLDSLEVAAQIADRYQRDPRVRRVCPLIVPVAGLLARAGETLREREFRLLAVVAQTPADECGRLLLTADRFANYPYAAVSEADRANLLDRFGLFGIRLCVELISSGQTVDATALARELVRRSGLDRLRDVLLRQFTERSRVLKARSALTGLQVVLASGGCHDPASLRARAEEITAGAHAFAEVRLLGRLRSEGLDLTEDRSAELDRLLGGSGHDPAARLGLAVDASAAEVSATALDLLARWQGIAAHPFSSRAVQIAARGASRTLEGILAGMSTRAG